MSKTEGQGFAQTSETGGGGDYATIKSKDVKYVEEEIPDSMMKAIRIIERLMTQNKYHE